MTNQHVNRYHQRSYPSYEGKMHLMRVWVTHKGRIQTDPRIQAEYESMSSNQEDIVLTTQAYPRGSSNQILAFRSHSAPRKTLDLYPVQLDGIYPYKEALAKVIEYANMYFGGVAFPEGQVFTSRLTHPMNEKPRYEFIFRGVNHPTHTKIILINAVKGELTEKTRIKKKPTSPYSR